MVSEKDYVDAKIDGARSELRADIAEMRADLRALGAKIEALPTTWTLIGTVAGGFAVSLSLLFTFLSYSGDYADSARAQQMQLDKVTTLSEQNARMIDRSARLIERNSRQVADLSSRMDRFLAREERRPSARE